MWSYSARERLPDRPDTPDSSYDGTERVVRRSKTYQARTPRDVTDSKPDTQTTAAPHREEQGS